MLQSCYNTGAGSNSPATLPQLLKIHAPWPIARELKKNFAILVTELPVIFPLKINEKELLRCPVVPGTTLTPSGVNTPTRGQPARQAYYR